MDVDLVSVVQSWGTGRAWEYAALPRVNFDDEKRLRQR
ncbi:hypothetical protein HGR_01542 [Hylemonella gracilis ATCC 19624]|uniref:Uncharacterized protein n=1 Tax=Hylemonella gracilis ATCC 19624 TaxID=887062 RepID=F3KPF1_9BURK|nr:hypothetical protein HGR_01542 [Hylemonella gracilis ATCC 19624]